MPTLECVCGYSCGSAKAWARHKARFANDGGAPHELVDPSLLPREDSVETVLVPASKGRAFALDDRTVHLWPED